MANLTNNIGSEDWLKSTEGITITAYIDPDLKLLPDGEEDQSVIELAPKRVKRRRTRSDSSSRK